MANVLRQISTILYRMKRNFGLPARLRVVSDAYNVQTGVVTPSNTDYAIRRVILLPRRSLRDFVYDLSFIAANKNFTYGGLFDADKRAIIIDTKDLPVGVRPTQDMIIIFDTEQYDILEVHRFEMDRGYILICKHVASTETV